MKRIHDKLGSPRLGERLLWTAILFFSLFFICVFFSYYFLPQGLLKGKNPLHNWSTSENIFICTIQILGFNLISTLIMIASGLFGQKKPHHKYYLSVGYVAFFSLICINAVVLGTWSFSVENTPVPLLSRFLRTFDIFHRAGLWEMLGQLLIVCASAHISIVLTNGKITMTRHIQSVRLEKAEKCTFAIGALLMSIGALVESIAINSSY